ncbi:HesA/MoeB/ThiF family protein [Longispora albida]|uniref:HesA/MoeB/ThiF family protein n=1 Tax=Longispora albida TaxID=203523 RepID=UPI0012F709B6|nr:ThiF family adenylyltransferase [Longispora albida]
MRSGVTASQDSDGLLHIVFLSTGRHCLYEVEGEALEAVRLLGDSRPWEDVLQGVQVKHPDFTASRLEAILDTLEAEDALDVAARAEVPPAGDVETAVYEKQVSFFRDFAGTAAAARSVQSRLRQGKVTVIGAGGMGSWVIQSLAMTGVGQVLVIDPDTVSAGNLSRQVLYGPADIGQPKALVVRDKIQTLTGGRVRVDVALETFSAETGPGIFSGSDLVINCSDEPSVHMTTDWVSAACMPQGIPFVAGGGYTGHIGFVGTTIVPGATACWECYKASYYEQPRYQLEHIAGDRRRAGAFSPMAAVIANLQAWDALRVLGGLGEPLLANRVGELDAQTLTIQWRTFERVQCCRGCATAEKG